MIYDKAIALMKDRLREIDSLLRSARVDCRVAAEEAEVTRGRVDWLEDEARSLNAALEVFEKTDQPDQAEA